MKRQPFNRLDLEICLGCDPMGPLTCGGTDQPGQRRIWRQGASGSVEDKGKTKSKGKRKSKKGLNILNGADSMGSLAASMIKENPAVAEKVEH